MKFLKNIFNPDHIIKKKNYSLKKKDQSINEITNTLKPILKGNINLQNDLIDIIDIPFVVLNHKDEVVYVNYSAKKRFKLFSSQKITHFFRRPEFSEKIRLFKKKNVKSSEFQIELFSLPFSVMYNVKLYKISNKRIFLSFQDITELNKLENLRSDFIGNVSHELKTPLSVLLSVIELLLNQKKISVNERKQFLSILNNESLKMKSIIEDLLNLTKIESQIKKKVNEEVNLNEIIKSSIKSLGTKAKKNKIRIKFVSRKIFIIKGVIDQLNQLVQNILDNSIKYAFKNSLINIVLKTDKKYIFLIFQDQGKGIPQHIIPRLTERFYRTTEVKSKKIEGSGLGLAIVKYIVIRHQAKLKISSELNLGTKIEIKFSKK